MLFGVLSPCYWLMGSLPQLIDADCPLQYNDNLPIEHFKKLYEAKFNEIEFPDNQPAIDKEFSQVRNYFLETTCGDMAVEPDAAILNGADAPDKAWPWQTLIHSDVNSCGGVLISDRWVLSAAHCFESTKNRTNYVELGMRITGSERGGSVFTRVATVIVMHEKYLETEYTYDIALVKLDSRVRFSERVRPACLPFHRNVFNESHICYITGFGDGAPDEDGHTTLQQLRVEVVPLKECTYFWRTIENVQVDRGSICVGARNKAGTCKGDSGGPLSCKDGSKYYVAGITNYSLNICMSNLIPDVYARVSYYLNWIFDVINKHQL